MKKLLKWPGLLAGNSRPLLFISMRSAGVAIAPAGATAESLFHSTGTILDNIQCKLTMPRLSSVYNLQVVNPDLAAGDTGLSLVPPCHGWTEVRRRERASNRMHINTKKIRAAFSPAKARRNIAFAEAPFLLAQMMRSLR